MLNFVSKAFRTWINVILWLTLIGCGIIGCILGYSIIYDAGFAVLGFILGGLVGLIICILGGGFIGNFLYMADNIEKIAKAQTEKTSL